MEKCGSSLWKYHECTTCYQVDDPCECAPRNLQAAFISVEKQEKTTQTICIEVEVLWPIYSRTALGLSHKNQ